jgi:hypothetical protein
MVNFANTLSGIQGCLNSDQYSGQSCAERQKAMTGASLNLAHSIRESIESGWGYSLPSVNQLQNEKELALSHDLSRLKMNLSNFGDPTQSWVVTNTKDPKIPVRCQEGSVVTGMQVEEDEGSSPAHYRTLIVCSPLSRAPWDPGPHPSQDPPK